MLYAVIDLGSNSIRLCIYKILQNSFEQIMSKKVTAGLSGYVHDGRLTPKGVNKAGSVLKQFLAAIQSFGIERYAVFATASLRNIDNREEVLEAIGTLAGVTPEILTGDEEARLGFLGATHDIPMQSGLVIDIGGGSTELVLFEEARVKNLISLPLGSLNLHTFVVKGIVPHADDYKKMKQLVRAELDKLDWEYDKSGLPMCGVGGTVRASLALAKELYALPKNARQVQYETIQSIVKTLKSGTVEEQKALYRVTPERIFSLAPGMVLLREVMKTFHSPAIAVSENGVREGFLIDRALNKTS